MVAAYQPEREVEPFTDEEVRITIAELKKKKTSGPDNILAEIMHELVDQLVP